MNKYAGYGLGALIGGGLGAAAGAAIGGAAGGKTGALIGGGVGTLWGGGMGLAAVGAAREMKLQRNKLKLTEAWLQEIEAKAKANARQSLAAVK